MISTTSIKQLNPKLYDEVWIVTRTLKYKPAGNNVFWIQDLSPSYELLNKYITWRRAGIWNEDTYNELYKPVFLKEMLDSRTCRDWLNQLYLKDKQGKHICLVCYCEDYNLCHRKLLVELIDQAKIQMNNKKGVD